MKCYLECYPCFIRQSIESGKIATNDEDLQHEIMKAVMKKTAEFKKDDPPALMGREVHRIIRKISKNSDPYFNIKKEYNEKATDMIPVAEEVIAKSADKLYTAIKLTTIANIIDFGPFGIHQVKLEEFMKSKLNDNFKGNCSFDIFQNALNNARSVLYVADNCGEIVFDTFFANNFLKDKELYLSVRGGVVLNDATKEDLKTLELLEHIKIIDNGDDSPGIILSQSSKEFIEIFNQVDMVILKGQGNFEGIGIPERKNVFSLLVAKCPVIARHIGCKINDLVLTIPA